MSQMEDDQHPEELSQVDNTPRPPAASPIVVAPTSASENAGQKRKIADLEENLTSGHTLKRQMITLLDNIEDLVGKNGCDKDDDDIHVTLVFSQDRLRIGYVALKMSSDSDSMEHDNHLHMSKRLKQRVYDLRGDVNGDQTIANTLMTQDQLRDSQRRIDTLHTELFDLRGRLYDAQVEHARDLAEIQREMLQMRESSGRNHKKLPSSPPKRKSMVHKYYPDGGQSIRWLTDEEFEPYDELSTEEGSRVAKVVGGPSSCGLAARRRMSLSRRWSLRRFQKVKDARANADDSEESVSTMYHRANGTPEI
ncbi:uncharacterized protein HD556DRAFT_1445986 [Suillus plorans]|uniref:Uncharacterized protein n=1 Tax=Suillus plorans TaxID=116603 RepID=A0A9P7AL10_9AGAM|nr:uncharacterized protein HD556DRAFT_1445986 [Suillus plorans]KAG1790703.1 hypothetical protein HD556DRAFT_1445986 [Suillus plorans]